MSFKAMRFLTTVLIVSLLIQMQIAATGYAFRRAKIAFTSTRDGNSEIYVMDRDGSDHVRLTYDPAIDSDPALSPDGRRIAFVSRRNGGADRIYVMDSDGEKLMQLTKDSNCSDPAWSPDGKKIAFVSNRNGGNIQIWVIDADGKNPIRLTDGVSDSYPDWSPDGNRIAFTSGNIGGDSHVYVMDADGRNPQQLTRDAGHKRMPSWSPDSRHIAYVSSHRIWVMDSDGENQRRLTNINGDEHPTWSPQSDAIAFHAAGRGDGRGIYVVDLTNGAVNVMQHAPGFSDREPDWLYPGELSVSPEGSRITMWGRLKKFASRLR